MDLPNSTQIASERNGSFHSLLPPTIDFVDKAAEPLKSGLHAFYIPRVLVATYLGILSRQMGILTS